MGPVPWDRPFLLAPADPRRPISTRCEGLYSARVDDLDAVPALPRTVGVIGTRGDMKRTNLIALVLVVLVGGVIFLFARPAPMDAAETRAYEARCMAAYTEWMSKKLLSPNELVECEKHYADKGDNIQASFFASARRGRGS
jgi:hypothetical protein